MEFSVAADRCQGGSCRWRGYRWMCKGLEPSCFHSPTFGVLRLGGSSGHAKPGAVGCAAAFPLYLAYGATEQNPGAGGVDFPLPVGYN